MDVQALRVKKKQKKTSMTVDLARTDLREKEAALLEAYLSKVPNKARYLIPVVVDQSQQAIKSFEPEDLIQLFQDASSHDTQSQVRLAQLYQQGQVVPKHDATSFYWYHKAAELGHAYAQLALAEMYYEGRGTEQSHANAASWSLETALGGDPMAQFNLGVMHRNGDGVERSDIQAVYWYRQAADQGFISAQVHLGMMHYHGQGTAQSFSEAAYWCRRAAEQGSAVGQNNLAWMYDIGQGNVAQDDAEALKWYLKSARQGHQEAQFCLGTMYELGQGTPRDDDEALIWFRKAYQQGHPDGILHFQALGSTCRRVLKAEADVMEQYRRMAELGDIVAQFNLGLMYEKGLMGVEKNTRQAVEWYDKAARRNHLNAIDRLLCYSSPTFVEPRREWA
ncbi:hypothetical protein DFQ26_006902 [Actinomortierella ambigua]|nr:hypothetical protein DFQ26_006902 [Actinomortierella ambigua]